MSATARTANVRQADDFYETPPEFTRAILPIVEAAAPVGSYLVDPCAGRGAIFDAVRGFATKHLWQPQGLNGSIVAPAAFGFEIDDSRAFAARANGHDVHTADALRLNAWGDFAKGADLAVLTNPPYALALPFVVQALTDRSVKVAAFLLRLNWLGSQKRADFHKRYPAAVYVLPARPSFCIVVTCKGYRDPAEGPCDNGPCGWTDVLSADAMPPRICPQCHGDNVRVTRNDATEYAWFVWYRGERGEWNTHGTWQILDIPEAT